jgi:hypothetical protein
VYLPINTGYKLLIRQRHGRFDFHSVVTSTPNDVYPIELVIQSGIAYVTKLPGTQPYQSISFQTLFPENNLLPYYSDLYLLEKELLCHSTMIHLFQTFTLLYSHLHVSGCLMVLSIIMKVPSVGYLPQLLGFTSLKAQGSGRIPTIPCSSYRAKAYRMISLLRFLYHVNTNIDANNLAAMQISTDSNSLIIKVTQYLQFDHYYPNATLEHD